ncbi:hypothetical protein [Kocuria palustris]|uniref:hypothetical protein n=1 Tax=Kocuria palustris TaxID=71999 RepID=UPI0035E29E5E
MSAPLDDPRRRGAVARTVPLLAPAMPLLLAAWLALSSAPVGGPGQRWPIWLGALGAPLALLLWIAAGMVLADARHYIQRRARPLTCWLMVVSWSLAVVLGALLPDLVDGEPASLFLAAFPGATPGLSSGFANTVGVLMFAAAAASLLAAALDVRRTRLLARGASLTPDPEDEDRLREQWLDSFR